MLVLCLGRLKFKFNKLNHQELRCLRTPTFYCLFRSVLLFPISNSEDFADTTNNLVSFEKKKILEGGFPID